MATQIPHRKTRGNTKGVLGFQGKGKWKNIRAKDIQTAIVPKAKSTQRESVTEAVTTGAKNKIENGAFPQIDDHPISAA